MWQELTGNEINQIVTIISAEDGTVETFIKNKKDYVERLMEVIKQYKEDNNV